MTPPRAAGRSRSRLLLLALPLLLVVAVLVNLGSVTELVTGKRSLRSIIYGTVAPSSDRAAYGWTLPRDTGAADAKVVIEVFVMAGDPCHVDTAYLGQALGTIDPKRIRVKFVNAATGKAATDRREKVKLGCDQGLAINGKTEFKIPDPAAKGGKRTVFTAHHQGETGGSTALYPILNQELKKAYHGKGLVMGAALFDERIAAEVKRVHEAALAAFDPKSKTADR